MEDPIEPTEIIKLEDIITPDGAELESHAQEDYEFARRNLRDLITKGVNLLDDASACASSGNQPEHYETAASILNGLISANKELLGLSSTHKKITGAGIAQEKNITNNNLFVGSSSDLLKMIRNHEKRLED